MKIQLVKKLWDPNYPQANYENIYEHTELVMHGTASYENGNHERFYARATVSMYGAIHMKLTVYHPMSLSDTVVAVTLNKAAFDKQGLEYDDMDAVVPLLVDHASKKNNYGVLVRKCVGVEFDEVEGTDASEFFEMMGVQGCALRVWECMRRNHCEFVIRREYVEGRYIPDGTFNEFVRELKGMGASINGFAPRKYVRIQA